jgi:two-component system cell cycle sensor histidine kinase/response regulator CckA
VTVPYNPPVKDSDAPHGSLAPPRGLGRYAATIAATALVTLALVLIRGHIRPIDIVLSYLALSLLVACFVGRREAALAMLLAPAGFAILLALGVHTAQDVLWEETARIAGVAALAVASVYAMPRWLSGADEFRATAERLRERSEFLEAMVGASPLAVISFDTETRVVSWNAAAEKIFGWRAHEVIGGDMRRFFTDDEFARIATEVGAVFAQGRPTATIEANLVRKDGGVRRIRFRINPITVAGDVVGAVGAADDITEARQLEEQVIRSQKIESLGRLAGGVAHDFSNLMTVIIGHVELDLISLPPEEQLREDLEEIHSTAQRAANLAQQLLSFSRRQLVEPRVMELNDIVFGTEKMLRRLIGEDVGLVISAAPDTGRVKVDRGQFEQVLVNLALNARGAMPDGGTLTISTGAVTIDVGRGRGRHSVLTVADTGTGITDEVKQHLFEPFFTTKAVGRGTGLGLATCYGIVQQAEGQIFVESEPGKGTAFRIYLPCVEEAAVEDEPGRAQPLPFGSETILLAEDEPQVRRLAARVLNDLGYKVIEAPDGERALAVADSGEKFDLLLTDVVMPGMNGNQLAQAVRERRPGQRVLFMSGYTDDAVLRRSLSEHAIEFLQKPFAPSALARKVRDVLDQSRDA